MLIRAISQEKAIGLMQEWNGESPTERATEAERMFRAMCDRYIYVEVESLQELTRLKTVEEFVTGGHGFYLYMRYPNEVVSAIRMGRAEMPRFLLRAEDRYASASGRGSLKLLFGLLKEEKDRSYDKDLFIDLLEEQRKQARSRPAYAPPAPTYSRPAETYSAPETYAPEEPVREDRYSQPEGRASVVHYHFPNQVS